MTEPVLQVAVPVPVRRRFDYLPPHPGWAPPVRPGVRVRVPFGRTLAIGVVVDVVPASTVDTARLKRVRDVIDAEPLLDPMILGLLVWASGYFQHPVGEVVTGTLPKLLRLGRAPRAERSVRYAATPVGADAFTRGIARAPVQARLLGLVIADGGVSEAALAAAHRAWRRPLARAVDNVRRGRYRRLALPHRTGGATPPRIDVVDLRARPFDSGLCDVLIEAIEQAKARSEQALLFINRRGYAPLLVCHACGWIAQCRRCDARLVYHRDDGRLRCHHCSAEHALVAECPECGSKDVRRLGLGTERVANALESRIDGLRVARMDRDVTRRRGALEALLDRIHAGDVDAVVGTQMLAKGHHFPNVTLVAILDADGGLFGVDFRAPERMAQLVLQVAGRAGRSDRAGRVLLQTHHPNHPLLRVLVLEGYRTFCEGALEERRGARLPPYASLALVRAQATNRDAPQTFLGDAEACARRGLHEGVAVLGPVPSPMERRAGRYRAQLLVDAASRTALQRFLPGWIAELEALASAHRVRWSVDVDPQAMA